MWPTVATPWSARPTARRDDDAADHHDQRPGDLGQLPAQEEQRAERHNGDQRW